MTGTDLDGRAVVVTGAAAGLGRAYALALAAAGARVVVNDVDAQGLDRVAGEIRAGGGRVATRVGSVADEAVAAGLVEDCREFGGDIDGLVNNAAVQHFAPFADEDEARVRRIVEINVLGSLLPTLCAFRAMTTQGHGHILNVTSGAHVGIAGLTTYGATKGAVASLTYNLAIEAAPLGVRVNALAPVAQTAMSPAEDRPDGVARPRPEQIAPVVVYLMSPASDRLNGQVVRYDGSSLSVLARPHFHTTRVTEDVDTVAGIARAFASELAVEPVPAGLY